MVHGVPEKRRRRLSAGVAARFSPVGVQLSQPAWLATGSVGCASYLRRFTLISGPITRVAKANPHQVVGIAFAT